VITGLLLAPPTLCLATDLDGMLTADTLEAPFIQRSFEEFSAGNFELSLQAANDALAANPDSAIAYNNICCAQIRLGAYDEAIEACNRALVLVPDYRLAYAN
jgi:tetratricopeptide (TPR) repeat protein